MSSVQTKLASAIFAGVLATLPLSTVFDGAARAADDCMTEPKGATPQGKHWFYRIERGTGRHCWYLRGEDEQARSAAPESTTLAKTPSRNADLIAPRSIADARAEWPAQPAASQDGAAAAPRIAPPAAGVTGALPPSTTAQAQAGGPWPDPSPAMPSLGAPPETTAVTADQQTDATAAPPPAAVPPPPALAAMPTDRNMGSLQKLLLVAFGALVLSGLTGSAVYRLAGARRRARIRRDRWPARKPQQIASDAAMTPWAPPKIETSAPPHNLARKNVEIDAVEIDGPGERVVRLDRGPTRKPQQIAGDAAMQAWAPSEIVNTAPPHDLARESTEIDDVDADGPGERVERIEDFLARLTRQLEAEMAAPRQKQRAAH